MTGWLAGWDRIPGKSSGTWAGGNPRPKLVLHTTEGPSIGSAVNAFTANNSWPHVTVDPVRRRRVQHVPLDAPARALRNTAAPGETNREPVTIQVEIVATAHNPSTAPQGQTSVLSLSDEDLDWLGTHVVKPLCEAAGVPIRTAVTFYGEDAGFTLASLTAKQRLSRSVWDASSGIFGHQHVPENTHWDPGPLDVARIIAAAQTQPPKPTEDDMTPEESKMLREIHEQLTVSRDDTAPQGATVRWGVFKSADRIKRVLGKG